jgi:WhiB family redox-sensing transcriptional regulator
VTWWERAACRDDSKEVWFEKNRPQREVTKILRRCMTECEVQTECLNQALSEPEMHGMWGGFSEQELFAIRTRRFSRCRECGRRWPKAKLRPTTVCRWCLIERLDMENETNAS